MKELLYNFGGYNQEIFYFINQFSNYDNLPLVLKYISHIFDIQNIAIYYLVTLTYLSYKISKAKVSMKPAAFSKYYDFMVKFGIGYACFGLIYAFLKFTINIPRPFCSLPKGTFETILDITKERCLSGFPSSHTGLTVLITLFIWEHIKPLERFICILIIGIVGISRITLAMHFPSDILYSIFIAILVYRISIMIYRLFENNLIKWVKESIRRFI